MNVEEVRAAVEAIRDTQRDDEMAHVAEDDLHVSVLAAIADGAPDAALLAAEALKTAQISFARWCA